MIFTHCRSTWILPNSELFKMRNRTIYPRSGATTVCCIVDGLHQSGDDPLRDRHLLGNSAESFLLSSAHTRTHSPLLSSLPFHYFDEAAEEKRHLILPNTSPIFLWIGKSATEKRDDWLKNKKVLVGRDDDVRRAGNDSSKCPSSSRGSLIRVVFR